MRFGDKVARLVVVEPVEEERCVRLVPDRDEESRDRELARVAGLVSRRRQLRPGPSFPQGLPRGGAVRSSISWSRSTQGSSIDCSAAELVTACTSVTLSAKAGEGGEASSIAESAAADDRHSWPRKKARVAERRLVMETPLPARPTPSRARLAPARAAGGNDDQRLGQYSNASPVATRKGTPGGKGRRLTTSSVDELAAETPPETAQVRHHLRPRTPLGVAGEVSTSAFGDHQLAPQETPSITSGSEHRPRRVEGGGW